ncbi:MAG TPA: hypothetical protein PKI89_12210 [Tepidiformaceae bacterium]|nr:hypothetical protein [Tepidiformaceae bacterium]
MKFLKITLLLALTFSAATCKKDWLDTFPPDAKYVERFLAAQHAAREAGRGMWAP